MDVQLINPHDSRVAEALGTYVGEVMEVCGMNGASLAEITADVDDYCPPTGAFLAVLDGDTVVACAGLRRLEPAVGEIKRMWVSPSLRGRGAGAELLTQVEQQAVRLGFDRLRLDTNEGLTAAVALYSSRGYLPIADYNGNPDATHFFEKRLRTIQG